MTRNGQLKLLAAPRRACVHVHHVSGLNALDAVYETICQELDPHVMLDREGFEWSWWSTRRCDCGFIAYTAPQGGSWSHRVERVQKAGKPG